MKRIHNKPIVVYVVGYGRSGSTLLDRLLGSVDGFHSCGEIFVLWRRALDQSKRCSCGELVKNCCFWNSVLEKSFEGVLNDDIIRQFAVLFYSTVNKRNLFNLCFPSVRSKAFQSRLENVRAVISRVYCAIAEVSGARIIVDSSKYPLYACFLSEADAVDLRLVHLVRDSRPVVFSCIRKKFVPEIGYTATKNPFGTALAWNLHNFLAERLQQKHKYVRVHYEELASNLRKMIIHIFEALDLFEDVGLERDRALASFKDENRVVLGRGHLVAGNAMRFKYGEMEIKLDEEWKKSLPLLYKVTTTLITAPFLKKYGYSLNWGASYDD